MLNSPGWPAAYGNNLDCLWNITAPAGRTIQLEILNFNTELCCDYLDVSLTELIIRNENHQIQIYSRDAKKMYEKQTSNTKYTFTNISKKR